MRELAGLYFGVLRFLLVLGILWALLPFAVFGMKPKMDHAIHELQKANTQLAQMISLLGVVSARLPPEPPQHDTANGAPTVAGTVAPDSAEPTNQPRSDS